MSEEYAKIESKEFLLKIEHDSMEENPREQCEHLGTFVMFHRRYDFGDIKMEMNEVDKLIASDKYYFLPVYMYDHSGITISTAPFSCPWDSGQIGYIFVDKDHAVKEFSLCPGITREEVEKKTLEILESEIKELDLYVTGSVYMYSLYRKVTCGECGQTELLPEESIGGILTEDPEKYIKENGKDYFGHEVMNSLYKTEAKPENVIDEIMKAVTPKYNCPGQHGGHDLAKLRYCGRVCESREELAEHLLKEHSGSDLAVLARWANGSD